MSSYLNFDKHLNKEYYKDYDGDMSLYGGGTSLLSGISSYF
jgi:hypothetical protein